ncbi:peptidyl-prolyl cis-trans isomerase, partial [bacterium]|nr:peptidyl-prolyl cis-trans isomerase [bacterium]
LERLERSLDAKNELDNAALYVEEGEGKKEDKSQIIAKIDEKTITMQDLESEIEKLLPNMQSEYNNPEKKLEILKQMVSMELFYRAAQRLGLDKDKEVIAKTFEIKKSLMAQKYLMDELKDKMKIEPEELKLYYEANKERYKSPKRVLVRMMSFKEKEKADSSKGKLDKGGNFAEIAKKESEDAKSAENGGLLGEIPYGSSVPGFKDSKKFYETVFALPENKISNVVNIDNVYYIFKVDKYIPGAERNINEVIEQVKEDVFRDKEFAEGMKLMERLGKTHDVKIFEDVVLGIQSK